MSYAPISGIIPQFSNASNELASGYYLKFYVANTTTPLSMATDSTGGTLLAKCKLNTSGIPISNEADNSTVFIPYVNQSYRLVIYTNSADADANATGSAFLNVADNPYLAYTGIVGTAAESAAAALVSEDAAAASESAIVADAAQTALDRIATAADLVLTNADVVLTHLDVVSTNADVVTTGNAVTAAEAAQAAAELVYDNFDDRYLGAKAVAPTLDNDGNALLTGAMYFDTVLEYMLVYTGTLWIPAGSSVNGTSQRESFTATASQTTFTVTGGYDPNFIDVYLNGAKLVNGVDVTVTSGTDVVLAVGATVGDAVDIVAYGTFAIADTYTKAEIDTKDGLKAPLASPTFTGTVTTGLVTATENISFATGKGIDFSAASGSAAGSTSAVLDDYEEGTWTPTVAGVTLTTGTGTYTKIGNVVYIGAFLNFPTNTDTTQTIVSGFPFPCNGNNSARAGLTMSYSTRATHTDILMDTNSSYGKFRNLGGTIPTNEDSSFRVYHIGGVYQTN